MQGNQAVLREQVAIRERGLDVLGIAELEERVYRALVLNPGARLRDLAVALDLSERRVQRLTESLESKGLARHSLDLPRRYHPSAPDMAIEALILQQQEDLQRARLVAQELQAEAIAARPTRAAEPMVELIDNSAAERLVFEQMHLTAQQELITLMRPPMRISELQPPFSTGLLEQASRRGVRLRTLVDVDYLELPNAWPYLRSEIAAGVEVRVAPKLPFKLVLVDHRMAMIPLRPEQNDRNVLLLRSSALLDAMHALFELLWARAAPACSFGDINSGDREPTTSVPADLLPLLALMSVGMNDKSIAHELAISPRTLERRMAALLKTLGARTRFHAGFLAAQLLASMPAEHGATAARPPLAASRSAARGG